MKIQGKSRVSVNLEAKYAQPFPVAASIVTVDGTVADLVIPTSQIVVEIDGKKYGGELMYVLGEVKE